MFYNNRIALVNEVKNLFQRYKNVSVTYDPEQRDFIKNLLKELNKPSSNVNNVSRNLLIPVLINIFNEFKYLPYTPNDPEDPKFTHYLLDFIKYFEFYKKGYLLIRELTSEFKKILEIMHFNPSIWENNPEKDEFISDLFYALKMPEIVCTECGGTIHNKKLKTEVLGIRKKIMQSYYDFTIEVPIFCCSCFDHMITHYNLTSHLYSRTNEDYSSLRIEMMNELQQLLALRRRRIESIEKKPHINEIA